MAIAATLKQYLSDQGVDYDAVAHPHTGGSLETAESAHVSGDDIAKAIVLKDEDGYLVAVLPATYKLQLGALREILGRRLDMADEKELAGLFTDCEPGAVPPGPAPTVSRRSGTRTSPAWRTSTSRAGIIPT